jgi:hypothetical protein
MKGIKEFLIAVSDVTAVPLFKFFYNLFTGFFIKTVIPETLRILTFFLEIYELSLKIPTKKLLNNGVVMELMHLVVVLVWVLYPQAIIWGYINPEKYLPVHIFYSAVALLVTSAITISGFLNYYNWIGKIFNFSKIAVNWILASRASFWVIRFYGFVKRIWFLGLFVKMAEWAILAILNNFWVFYGFLVNFVSGSEGVSEDGEKKSIAPKVLLSLVLIGFKIIRAIKVIKDVQKGE